MKWFKEEKQAAGLKDWSRFLIPIRRVFPIISRLLYVLEVSINFYINIESMNVPTWTMRIRVRVTVLSNPSSIFLLYANFVSNMDIAVVLKYLHNLLD